MTAGHDAWLRWYWIWDGYYALAFTFTVYTLLSSSSGERDWQGWVATGAVLAILLSYLLLIRPGLVHGVPEANLVPGALLIAALFLGGVVITSEMGFALFAVSPMMFMSLPMGGAMAVMPVLVASPLVMAIIRSGAQDEAVRVLAPMTVLLAVLAPAFGFWTHRVVRQSAERGELIERLEQTRAELARLSHEAGIAAERERLAGEIHDTLAQGFTSIVTLVQAADSAIGSDDAAAKRHLEIAARTARENLTEARALISALTPSALGSGSLGEALRRQLTQLGEDCALRTEYIADSDIPALSTAVEVVVLRTAQEALSNVRKHAAASSVTLRLTNSGGAVRLAVRDDGRGFDPSAVNGGYGLSGMRSRVGQVGGTITVHSGPDAGTSVELEVPR